jgi:hypothetical protein
MKKLRLLFFVDTKLLRWVARNKINESTNFSFHLFVRITLFLFNIFNKTHPFFADEKLFFVNLKIFFLFLHILIFSVLRITKKLKKSIMKTWKNWKTFFAVFLIFHNWLQLFQFLCFSQNTKNNFCLQAIKKIMLRKKEKKKKKNLKY